jgi:hypothetical protein
MVGSTVNGKHVLLVPAPDLKVVVYGICKNEAKFAERFMVSTVGADQVIVCDTGSTDGTQEILRGLGATVYDIVVSPWRFDLARNMALLYVQEADVAISMDMDEVLLPGWRDVIESKWQAKTTMLRYPFIHNWDDEAQTIPRLSVWGFKVHCPWAYLWRYPIHETLELRDIATQENIVTLDREILRHYPDPLKLERWDRIELLRKAVSELPDDQRMSHLYGRELWFHGQYEEAVVELKRHLSITQPYIEPQDDADGIGQTRSTSCRLIGRCLMAIRGSPDEIMVWLLRSVGESPSQREPWMWLAHGWLTVGDRESAQAAAKRGLAITDRLRSIEVEEQCWGKGAEVLVREIKKVKRGGKHRG